MTIRTDEASCVEDMRKAYTEYYGAERADNIIKAMKAVEILDAELSISVIFTALHSVITNPEISHAEIFRMSECLEDVIHDAIRRRKAIDASNKPEGENHDH